MYDRKIKKWDEPHSPEKLDSCLKNGMLSKGKFLTSDHFFSYYLQMKTIHELGVRSVLEIGPGEAFVADYMKSLGVHYDTMDIATSPPPTFNSRLEFFDESCLVGKYSLVCAFQMLEHSPYEQFVSNLEKMQTMSNHYVFISLPYSCFVSLPYSCFGGKFDFNFHFGQGKRFRKKFSFFFPLMKCNRRYRAEYMKEFPWAVHYWEIGRKSFMKRRILSDIESIGLKIINKFYSDNPFHFFILAEKYPA